LSIVLLLALDRRTSTLRQMSGADSVLIPLEEPFQVFCGGLGISEVELNALTGSNTLSDGDRPYLGSIPSKVKSHPAPNSA